MKSHVLILLLCLVLGAAACSDAGDADGTDEEGGEALVTEVDTELGTVLATADGRTLYGFLPDEAAGAPTCTGDCVGSWPVLAAPDGEVPDGLDTAVFSVTTHPEAGDQLQAGGWPLYTFAGDTAEGDVTGQGVGDAWFAVGPDGELIR